MDKACSVIVGQIPDHPVWPYVHCGKKPASPLPETEGTDFDFPMCEEHKAIFRKT